MSTPTTNNPEHQQPQPQPPPNSDQHRDLAQDQDQDQEQAQQPPTQNHPPNKNGKDKLPIHTHHCRFCNHLLLATTLQSLSSLPTRKPPAKDGALIVPLSLPASSSSSASNNKDAESDDKDGGRRKDLHTTILLSTTQPDRGSTIVRREDGFEKRRLLRCGRCRVVVGYFLDGLHFASLSASTSSSSGGGVKGQGGGEEEGEDGENDKEERDEVKVVYLLPGALMETGVMVRGDQEELRRLDQGWSSWV